MRKTDDEIRERIRELETARNYWNGIGLRTIVDELEIKIAMLRWLGLEEARKP